MQLSLSTKIRIGLYVLKSIATKPTFFGYDPNDTSGYYPDPNPLNARMLAQHGIFFSPRLAAWVCSLGRFETFEMAKDDRFSVNFKDWMFAPRAKTESQKNELDRVLDSLLMALPSQDHMRTRRLVQPAFLPKNIAKMDSAIKSIVEGVLNELPQECNIVDATSVIPLRVVAALVGVPLDYQKEFKGLADSILATYSPTESVDPELAFAGLKIVREVIEDRRRNPRDDFISVLVQTADSDGDQLSIDEVIAFVASLLTAGPDTTSHYLNFALQTILTVPGLCRTLRENKNLIPDAITEASRVNYFAHSGGVRFATQDVVIKGQKIKKGEMIKFNVNTANLDPAVFPDPFEFNLYRENLKEAWIFGAGSHFCVGAALAKAIGVIFIETFIAKFPGATLLSSPRYEKDFISRKMVEMRVGLY